MSSGSFSPGPTPAASPAVSRPSIPDFELVRIVGRGSYGDVWLARSVTGAWRAIKIVWRERFPTPEPFEREFRGLKEFADVCLGESSQMTLLHVGRSDAAGFFYYVMELADDAERGRQIDPANYVPLTLAEMRTRRERITADECARIGAEVARGLATLHRRGLVHRDVKPSNVILVSGVPKLADVGLVAPSASAHTFVGTEGYVPPEGPGAPSADVFALAKMLYELATGHDRQEFPKLPTNLASLPDRAALLELNEILLRACGPALTGRYRDGAAILTDLIAMNRGVSLRTRRLAAFALRTAAVIAGVVTLAWAGWAWKTHPPAAPPVAPGITIHSVAVLPFANATGDPEQDYLASGLSDEILHALERERDLNVTGSRAAFAFRDGKLPRLGDRALSSVEIAKLLKVAQLVEGTMHRNGSRIRLEVRLTRGADGVAERIRTFEREEADIFKLEDDVARAAAQKILHRVTMPPLQRSTTNLEAYHEFLRGRVWQMGAVAKSAPALDHFERAVQLDPHFAVAWARLADTRRMIGQNRDDKEMKRDAEAAAQRAMTENPDLALAWTVRGFVRNVVDGDSMRGLRDVVRAEELGGENAETRMTRFLLMWSAGESQGLLQFARLAIASNPENIERPPVALALWSLGEFVEADRLYLDSIAQWGPARSSGAFQSRIALRREWRGAQAALNLADRAPAEQQSKSLMQAIMLGVLGRHDEAAQRLEGVDSLRVEAYLAAGMNDRARSVAEKLLPETAHELRKIEADPDPMREPIGRDRTLEAIIWMEIVLDRHESAFARLDAWRRSLPQRKSNRRWAGDVIINMPRFYAMLGLYEDAITLLQQIAADGRNLGYTLRDTPEYDPLRKDSRFLALQKQAEAWAAMQPDPPDDPPATPSR